MRMLSVLQSIVEIEGRKAIRAVEWLLRIRGEQENGPWFPLVPLGKFENHRYSCDDFDGLPP
jgi:hypothetical protein